MAEVKVPEVGESITEVFIGAWLKNEGDAVEKDEPLVEIETDKATLEVPAPVSGTLTGVTKKQGDSAIVGEVIAQVGDADAADTQDSSTEDTGAQDTSTQDTGTTAEAEPQPAAEADTKIAADDEAEPAAETKPVAREENEAPELARDPEPGEATDAQAQKLAENVSEDSPDSHIMPAAQRLLDEHGLSARDVRATGPGGRLLKEDVQRAVDEKGVGAKKVDEKPTPQKPAQPAPAQKEAPAQTPAATGDRQEETVPMSPLRRRIAERLVEAQQNAALLTTFNEVDMSAIMALRSEFKEAFQERYEGTRLGFMSFFVKAVIDALKTHPAAQRRNP